ncbi:DUF4225 domain-containing protein [Klebsiella aerogenes]|uniref:DUF4225 domain-containing protein n=1 Tax=Klebsiella aerogenes TaxID=548 RepID=UPI0039790450|nr:DUF4225 domain-containing protein [Klebsiella aerogenes]
MDVFFGKTRFSNYFMTMAQAETNGLMNTAQAVSAYHLHDPLTRIRFQESVKRFALSQINIIRNSSDDKQCQQCIQAIRQERENLLIQDRMLRTGEAMLTASVRFYRENEKIIGYIIDGIGVVLGGMQVIGGFGITASSLMTGNVIGVIAGATLMFHGFGTMAEKLDGVNFAEKYYEDASQFLGFSRELGKLSYQVVDLSTSFYGLAKLTLKPEAWRLFYFTGPDFYRKVTTMSKPAMALKGISSTVKGIQIGNTMYEVKDK